MVVQSSTFAKDLTHAWRGSFWRVLVLKDKKEVITETQYLIVKKIVV